MPAMWCIVGLGAPFESERRAFGQAMEVVLSAKVKLAQVSEVLALELLHTEVELMRVVPF
jgi:hypothetical protein